ncbi:hypothetical protein P3T40_006072 [Paraburkholderia sp. EB58]|jgi:hypothetical protein|uniref:hypothetical protein n=1 Tax=Paraburkholderia sp. EB58 TaxID=3035125 RepID=UPI003D257D74
MESMQRWTLKWAHGEATAQSLGGMLAPVQFDLGGGRTVSPLYVAPWGDDVRWPGLLRALRGEWPCLPFGTVAAPAGLPPGFETRNATDTWIHGYGANHMWRLVEKAAHRLTLRVDYPPEGEIESLERTIEVAPDAPALIVSLTVHTRKDVVLPFALHPTFAIPDEGIEVLACPHQAIHSYPVPPEPGVSRALPNQTFASLKELATATGLMDVTRLPLSENTEELLQIAGCRPPFVLRYSAQQADVLLDWNPDELPDALLWISNGGRTYAPWSGRNFALGVEPAQSFFDLGRVVVPPADHPLAGRTGLAFRAGMPRTISYRLSARPV